MISRSVLTIKPLVQQHADHAAFYWQQIQESCSLPLLDLNKLNYFHFLLNVNLDGLRVAGDTSWDLAFDNLEIWQSSSEMFVCGVLAFESGHTLRMAALLNLIDSNSQALRLGLASALAYLPRQKIESMCLNWLKTNNVNCIVVALRALGAHHVKIDANHLHALYLMNIPQISSALYFYLSKNSQDECKLIFLELHKNMNAEICEHSALALLNNGITEGELIYDLMARIDQCCSISTKSFFIQRRIEQLVKIVAQILPPGAPQLETILAKLPPYLQIIFLGYHGDAAQLSSLSRFLEDQWLAPMVFWAFSLISGVDINDPYFLCPEKNIDEFFDRYDIDAPEIYWAERLSFPDTDRLEQAIRAFPAPENSQRLLAGKAVTPMNCQQILNDKNSKVVACKIAQFHLAKMMQQQILRDIRWDKAY